MQFSTEVIRAMGYRPLNEGEQIRAQFFATHVYSIRGVTISDEELIRNTCSVAGQPVELAVCNSVNQAVRAVCGHDFTNDEAEWCKELGCHPPFVVLRYGPTAMHLGTGCFVQEVGDWLDTFDSFGAAKVELVEIEEETHPNVIAALACALGNHEAPRSIVRVCRSSYGITDTGRRLRDFYIQGSATVWVSRRMTKEDVEGMIGSACQLASTVLPRAARFLHLGLEEDDRLKKFLYCFLAIEIQTNTTFKAIDPVAAVGQIFRSQVAVQTSMKDWLTQQKQGQGNLRDRFLWCAVCQWPHLTDTDIDVFKSVKKVRDRIAHGEIAEPPPDAVQQAQMLATKVLSRP